MFFPLRGSMKFVAMLMILAAAFPLGAAAQAQASPFAGRWDITAKAADASYPSWMEFVQNQGAPSLRIQPRTGSVRPASDVVVEGSHMTLTVSPASANAPKLVWELDVEGDKLTGTQRRGDTVAQLAGVR